MAELRIVADSVVHDATEDRWRQNREGQLRDDLGPEVRTRLVHVIVDLSQEDGPLIREDQNDVLNSVEGDVHAHEEEGSLHVLHTSIVKTGVEEEKNGETGGQAGREQLHVGGLGQADQV